MPTQLPLRPTTETPGMGARAAADPATPPASARIPEWVRHLPNFPRLEGLIEDPTEVGSSDRSRARVRTPTVTRPNVPPGRAIRHNSSSER